MTTSFTFRVDAEPEVVQAGRYPLADREFPVCYSKSGSTHAIHLYDYRGRIRMGGKELHIQPGVLTITPRGMGAWYDLDAPGFHLCVHFRFSRQGSGNRLQLPLHMDLGPLKAAAEARFMSLIWWCRQREHHPEAEEAASLVLRELLIWLGWTCRSNSISSGPKARQSVVNAATEIERYLSRGIRVPEVCRIVGLSQNYLSKLFHREFGVTMNEYRVNRQIDHARHLLECTPLTVKEVGIRVGIPDPQHFNKRFRKVTGSNPTAYRAGRGRP